MSSGLDDSGNEKLDDAEIRNRTPICNPALAAQPPAIVLRLRPEPKGANCAVGGTAVESGPDANRNDQLDDAEVAPCPHPDHEQARNDDTASCGSP